MATLGTLLAPDLIQTGSCWQLALTSMVIRDLTARA